MQPCRPNACCEKQSTIFTLSTISDKGATLLSLGSPQPQCGSDLQKGVKWNDSTARVIECSGKQNGWHKIGISMMLTGYATALRTKHHGCRVAVLGVLTAVPFLIKHAAVVSPRTNFYLLPPIQLSSMTTYFMIIYIYSI